MKLSHFKPKINCIKLLANEFGNGFTQGVLQIRQNCFIKTLSIISDSQLLCNSIFDLPEVNESDIEKIIENLK